MPFPPMITGGPGRCAGFGSAGESVERVVLPLVGEPLPLRRRPEPGDDRQLFLEPVEPLAGRRERDAVAGVLLLEPARSQPELDPATAHLVDLGHLDRQRSRVPEGGRRHQRAQPDRGRLARQAGQRRPGVGRAGRPVDAHREVVVGAEERVEAEVLGSPGHPEELVVGRALLGLGEHTKIHANTVGAAPQRPTQCFRASQRISYGGSFSRCSSRRVSCHSASSNSG